MKKSLQYKILLSFSIIIFVGLSALLFVSYKITEENVLHNIKIDMIDVKKNLDIYMKQYFLINDIELNKETILGEADNISMELSSEVGNLVEIFTSDGKKVSNNTSNKEMGQIDFSKALNGETAYTIDKQGEKFIVTLSYPIKVSNKIICIIRYSKDYTDTYDNMQRFKYIINLFAALIFIVIFIVSFILARKIVKPLRILAESSEQVASGNYNINLRVNSSGEIGDLAKSFETMFRRIKEQIEIIKNDRDALKESQSQNKAFFDNVTHELKTPLTTIMGYAEIIKENGFNDKDFFEKGTTYIVNESKRLNSMVVDVLELSKVSSGDFNYNFEKIDFSGLVTKTCEEMAIKSRKYKIEILCNSENNLHLIGDSNKLKEAIVNLIDNSIKYGDVNSKINVDVFKEGNSIYMKIKDKGVGIPEKHLAYIFEPFYMISKKDSREKGSAGLGLAIVKNIIDNHNGTIEINSKVNEGTEVLIRLNSI